MPLTPTAIPPLRIIAKGALPSAGTAVPPQNDTGVLARSPEGAPGERDRIAGARRRLVEDGRPVERYRRIALDEAIGLLAPQPERRLSAV